MSEVAAELPLPPERGWNFSFSQGPCQEVVTQPLQPTVVHGQQKKTWSNNIYQCSLWPMPQILNNLFYWLFYSHDNRLNAGLIILNSNPLSGLGRKFKARCQVSQQNVFGPNQPWTHNHVSKHLFILSPCRHGLHHGRVRDIQRPEVMCWIFLLLQKGKTWASLSC